MRRVGCCCHKREQLGFLQKWPSDIYDNFIHSKLFFKWWNKNSKNNNKWMGKKKSGIKREKKAKMSNGIKRRKRITGNMCRRDVHFLFCCINTNVYSNPPHLSSCDIVHWTKNFCWHFFTHDSEKKKIFFKT